MDTNFIVVIQVLVRLNQRALKTAFALSTKVVIKSVVEIAPSDFKFVPQMNRKKL